MTKASEAADKRKLKKATDLIVRAALEEGVVRKELSLKGKTEAEINRAVRGYLLKVAKRTNDFFVVIDHRKSLLREARNYKERESWDMAAMLYATYFEHSLNSFILTAAEHRKLHRDTIKRMIQATNLEDKASWVLEVLQKRPIDKRHRAKLQNLGQIRNGFVHYKWTPMGFDQENPAKKVLEKIEDTVSYFRRYEGEVFYLRERGRIRRIIKSARPKKT